MQICYSFSQTQRIKFSRLAFPGQGRLEIHGFCDASLDEYGACVYGLVGSDCRLLCSRSRVAPIKTQMIPNLELFGVELLARGWPWDLQPWEIIIAGVTPHLPYPGFKTKLLYLTFLFLIEYFPYRSSPSQWNVGTFPRHSIQSIYYQDSPMGLHFFGPPRIIDLPLLWPKVQRSSSAPEPYWLLNIESLPSVRNFVALSVERAFLSRICEGNPFTVAHRSEHCLRKS